MRLGGLCREGETAEEAIQTGAGISGVVSLDHGIHAESRRAVAIFGPLGARTAEQRESGDPEPPARLAQPVNGN